MVLTLTGIVEREEIEGALAAALAHPRSRPGLGLMWDARLSQSPLSAEELEWRFALVASLATRGALRRAALLVNEGWRGTLDYSGAEAARMAPGLPVEMHTDQAAALAWLGAGQVRSAALPPHAIAG